MPDTVFLATLVADVLFLASGAIELGFSIGAMSQMNKVPTDGEEATRQLLYRQFPLMVAIVNASFVLASFVFTIPGLVLPKRKLLKFGGYLITFCGLFTLAVGLYLWILTLRFKDMFAPIYSEQDPSIQALIQTSFECCGYSNFTSPAFVTNPTCPSPAASALLSGCASSISSYANTFTDQLFTALFGMVGVDALLIIAIACHLKDRKERERYRLIDEKSGYHL